MSRIVPVTLIVAFTLSLAGCSQGEGDRCEVTSDCSSGLECQVPADQTDGSGTCVKPGTAIPDAGRDTAKAETPVDGSSEPAVEATLEATIEAGAETAAETGDAT